jgi:hypothetical protein
MSPLPDLVIGALLALLGVLVSQLVAMLQARLERQNRREVLLRTKYEELGAHFLDSMKLPHALMTCTGTEDILVLTHQTSGNNAHLLALLYFPSLRQATGQYIDSYSALLMTATSLYNPNDKRPLGMQVFDKPEYIQVRDNHLVARDHLQEQIEAHAPTYAKS